MKVTPVTIVHTKTVPADECINIDAYMFCGSEK